MQLKDVNETFAEDMTDPEYVAGYLEAVLKEADTEAFLIALCNVAKAGNTPLELRDCVEAEQM